MQLELACDGTASAAVGLCVGVGRVEGDIFSCDLMLESYFVVIVYLLCFALFNTLNLEIDFFVQIGTLYSMYHWQ